jgi:hypothetical protein
LRFTTKLLVCTKDPGKKEGDAIGSLSHVGRRLAGNPVALAAGSAVEEVGKAEGLTFSRFAAGVGAVAVPTRLRGGARRRRPRRPDVR